MQYIVLVEPLQPSNPSNNNYTAVAVMHNDKAIAIGYEDNGYDDDDDEMMKVDNTYVPRYIAI